MSSIQPWILCNTDVPGNMETSSRHDTPSQQPELKFCMISNPAEAKTARNKRIVRSHVARTAHAKNRYEKSIQRDRRAEGKFDAIGNIEVLQLDYDTFTSSGPNSPSNPSHWSIYRNHLHPPAGSSTPTGHGHDVLPVSHSGQLSPWEQYLVHYCM